MANLFEDVSLATMVISKDGKSISFTFAEMCQGLECGILECRSVYVFDYHCIFELDGLPAYVGQVSCAELSHKEAVEKIEEVKFRFYVDENPERPGAGGRTRYVPKDDKVYWIDIEGGEVSIRLVCGEYKTYE